MALAVVLYERLGHPQFAAARIRRKSRLVIKLEKLGVVSPPQIRHPLLRPAMVIDAVEVTGHRPVRHAISLIGSAEPRSEPTGPVCRTQHSPSDGVLTAENLHSPGRSSHRGVQQLPGEQWRVGWRHDERHAIELA